MNEEILLENETYNESDLSFNEDISLDDKLDRIEALLNEDISLRENETEASDLSEASSAASVENNNSPDYNQYIYDLLTDSNIKVEVVSEEKSIFEKQLNEYTVTESLEVIGIMLAFIFLISAFINKYTFKRR